MESQPQNPEFRINPENAHRSIIDGQIHYINWQFTMLDVQGFQM